MNDLSPIGHNSPPETPFDSVSEKLQLLHIEASNWLDGDPIETQAQADKVSDLINDIRKARKSADDARKLEAKPFDEGKKKVQERYKPLLDNADTMSDGCKKLLAPFLAKIEAAKRAKAEEERRKADEAAKAAQEATRAARDTDLAAREEAEMLIQEAARQEAAAKRAETDKARGKGHGRAITLRTVYRPEVTDYVVAARHYWQAERDEIAALIDRLVAADVRAGKHTIPGVVVHEEQVAR